MAKFLQSLFGKQKGTHNKHNEAFYKLLGGGYTEYDVLDSTYIEQGFLKNPVVYSVVRQRADKARQVPMLIKRVQDEKAYNALLNMHIATKRIPNASQNYERKALETKAFKDEYVSFPMDKPNPLQSWGDLVALYETFIALTGNCYFYLLKGEFSKEPLQVYILPSHLIEIVIKPQASMLGMESPIDYYMLRSGTQWVSFKADEVLHIKTPNPDYDFNGSHLYGLSPLKAALRNIQSSNEGINNNIRTQRNSGAFGFLHGTKTPLTSEQAAGIRDRLTEMRNSDEVLSHIAGSSSELGFTRISLTTDELKPFDYLDFDRKQICNVLGWDDKLLNNDAGAKYDNVQLAEQRVVVNTILPSLHLLAESLQNQFLPLFKGYENTVFEFDPSQLPEMQQDIGEMVNWLTALVDRGVVNRDEAREQLKIPKLGTRESEAYTVSTDILTLTEAIENGFTLRE